MDFNKVMLSICAFILIVCLTLCITTLSVLRNAVAENGIIQKSASSLVDELNSCMDEMEELLEKNNSVEVSVNSKPNESEKELYLLRDAGGLITVFTKDGYLIKNTEIHTSTLPAADREALAKGIEAESWERVLELLSDYGA